MKILFVTMMFVFSALAQAGDQQEASVPLGVNGYPLRWSEMSIKEKTAWKDKKRQKIEEENERRYLNYNRQEALEGAALEKEREATRPKCMNIRFTGIAASAYLGSTIKKVLASEDIEDTVARNKFHCSGLNMGADQARCDGFTFLQNHKGRIMYWDREFYIINTPMDFDIGRRNVELAIRRQDAVCAN